jgi:molybdopterin-guanine dinucleotide biosynthesis protein A
MNSQTPIVIVAGGKSSRMGKDKALLPFGGYNSLAQYQYQKLHSAFNNVYISTKEHKFDFNAPLIVDSYQVHSPLGAIISILEYTKKPTMIISVDIPFISIDVIKQIIDNNNTSYIATIAQSINGLEPLCAIYNLSFIPIAKQYIENNNHKINYILKNHNINRIQFEDKKLFLNLNYPSDYTKALKLC